MAKTTADAQQETYTRLVAAGRRYRRLIDQLDEARRELDEVIPAAALAGVRQVDIVRETGLTRETVRRIVDPSKADRANRARRSTPIVD